MRNIFALMGVLVLALCGYVFSQPEFLDNSTAGENTTSEATGMVVENASNTEKAVEEEPVNEKQRTIIGNKVCPVSGGLIKTGTQAEYVYKGRVYNFCSLLCIETFQQDPERYLMLLEENEKAAAAKEKESDAKKPAAEKK